MTGWNDEIRDLRAVPPLPLAAWKTRVAGMVLWLEALTIAFWKPAALAVFYAGISLGAIPEFFGALGPLFCAVAFYGASAVLIWRGARGFAPPAPADVLRRMERENALPHRPLSALYDHAEVGDRDLWRLAQETRWRQARRVRPFFPGPVLARRDPLGLRYLAALTLCVGLVMAGARWPERMEKALFPFRLESGGAAREDESIVLWITPPAYTGFGKLVLKGGGALAEPITLPQGSILKIRVTGGLGTPLAQMGPYRFALSDLGGGSRGAELMAIPGKEFTLRQMFWSRLSFPYNYVVDTPPVITLTQPPEILPGGRLRFKLPVRDDYGVRDLRFSMRAAPADMPPPAVGKPVEETRPVMTEGGNKEVDVAPVYDLTAHPWAGLPVLVTFTATDAIGQTAQSETLRITLPERVFRHPIAKQIVDLRRELIQSPVDSRENVSRALENILVRPGLYGGNPVVFLALRAASSRLYYNHGLAQINSVVPLLWDIALQIEDGDLSLAARDLRQARDALEQALRDPKTTPEQLAVLNDQLRMAMANYLREMSREIQKRMAEGERFPLMPSDSQGNTLNARMLEGLLDRLQSESLDGNRDKAMEMLSALQKMTDFMDGAMNTQLPPDVKFMNDGVDTLQNLVDRQQQLLEQTQQQTQGLSQDPQKDFSYSGPAAPRTENGLEMGAMPPAPAPGKTPGPSVNTVSSKGTQEAVRRALNDLIREAEEKLGKAPDSLGKAEAAMGQSSEALGDGRPGDSIPHQEAAIQHLKDGAQQLGQQMIQRLEQMTGMTFSQGRTDPLGRPLGPEEGGDAPSPEDRVKVPSEFERRRIDEILKTLRDRSSDYTRPQEEIDYLRRLLKQF